eukprot:502578-Karenia_brevis.AAC.1
MRRAQRCGLSLVTRLALHPWGQRHQEGVRRAPLHSLFTGTFSLCLRGHHARYSGQVLHDLGQKAISK